MYKYYFDIDFFLCRCDNNTYTLKYLLTVPKVQTKSNELNEETMEIE